MSTEVATLTQTLASARQNGQPVRVQLSRRLARHARLRYVSDSEPGVYRRRSGRGFVYVDSRGNRVTDAGRLERIGSLVIPPAWTDVWICTHENGHLQATGRDDRGRKQYLYHERWREVADRLKFERLLAVGKMLPKVRHRVEQDLRRRKPTREDVVAVMVRLLDLTGIRVGNTEYQRDNDTYGLTTLRNRHIEVRGGRIVLDFHGKGKIRHKLELQDRQLATALRRILKLPGRVAFQYVDSDGICPVSSDDVNQYLSETTAGVMTAKDFRTWRASVHVAAQLAAREPPRSVRRCKRVCMAALETAAQQLCNTVTVCRKYYVHTGIVDAYMTGEYDRLKSGFSPRKSPWYTREEQLLLHILRNLADEAPG